MAVLLGWGCRSRVELPAHHHRAHHGPAHGPPPPSRERRGEPAGVVVRGRQCRPVAGRGVPLRAASQLEPSRPACGWIMLNPSRADATDDDPTVRRCLGFASAWGYGSLLIHNLYVFSVGRGCGRLTTGLLPGVEPSACVAHGCVRRSRKLTTGNAHTPGRAPADDSAVGPEPQHLHDPGSARRGLGVGGRRERLEPGPFGHGGAGASRDRHKAAASLGAASRSADTARASVQHRSVADQRLAHYTLSHFKPPITGQFRGRVLRDTPSSSDARPLVTLGASRGGFGSGTQHRAFASRRRR